MTSPSTNRPLGATEIVASLARLEGWHLSGDGADVAIVKTYGFADFQAAMAFANMIAFIAEARNHHPELRVSSEGCTVRWRTHECDGISRADLDCAARVDALLASFAT